MIRFVTYVRVERPPEEVFAYLSDPSNLREWQGTAELEQLTPGPVRVGTRFREVQSVAGRRNEQVTEVDEFDPPHRFGVRVVQGPLRVDGRWELSAVDGGTLLTLRAQGPAPRALRFAEPLIARILEARFKGNHKKLKRAVEHPG